MASFPRSVIPFEVSALDMPGPLIAKAQAGRVNIRSTQQIGRTWTEHYLINVRTVAGRAMLAAVDNFYRNGTIFTIDHRDHLTPMGAGGGSPLVNSAPQLVTQPENFGAWTAINVTPLSGQADPFGGTGAYKLTATAGADNRIQLTTVYTGNGVKAAAAYAKVDSAAESSIKIEGASNRHQVKLTWTAGVPTLSTTLGSGTLFAVESTAAAGWYRISFNANGVIAADGNTVQIYPAVPSGTGSSYWFGANSWNSSVPLPYLSTTGAPTQTGAAIVIDGATASIANWLRAGDIIRIGGLSQAFEVSSDVTTDSVGVASLPIVPPIFSGGAPADNAVVTITGVTLQAVILEPPSFPSTSGVGADWGELVCKFSESL